MAQLENDHQRQARENREAMRRSDETALILTATAIAGLIVLLVTAIKWMV